MYLGIIIGMAISVLVGCNGGEGEPVITQVERELDYCQVGQCRPCLCTDEEGVE